MGKSARPLPCVILCRYQYSLIITSPHVAYPKANAMRINQSSRWNLFRITPRVYIRRPTNSVAKNMHKMAHGRIVCPIKPSAMFVTSTGGLAASSSAVILLPKSIVKSKSSFPSGDYLDETTASNRKRRSVINPKPVVYCEFWWSRLGLCHRLLSQSLPVVEKSRSMFLIRLSIVLYSMIR